MKSYPFNSKNIGTTSSPEWDRAITAEDERQFNKLYFTNGIFANPPNSLMVRPGGGMKIEVSPGGCHIEGAKAYSTESRYITLSNSDSQLSRIDRVLVRFDLAEAVRSIEIYVREGVPSTTPRPPEIHRESTYYELVLADVLVKSGTNSISSSQITDQRLNPDLCGMVVPLADQKDTSELWAQIKDSIELVNASLDGTTAGQLEGRIGEVETELSKYAPKNAPTFTGQVSVQDTLKVKNIDYTLTDAEYNTLMRMLED